MTNREPLMTALELAEHLGVSRAHVYNLMRRGLPSVEVGRSRRFRLSDVDAWLNGGAPKLSDPVLCGVLAGQPPQHQTEPFTVTVNVPSATVAAVGEDVVRAMLDQWAEATLGVMQMRAGGLTPAEREEALRRLWV